MKRGVEAARSKEVGAAAGKTPERRRHSVSGKK
jgi:hypothetical protein